MIYYLAPGEHDEMQKRVKQVVDSAAEFISSRINENARE
jgi:hypothetical protein